jgi:UDP-N-acetylglucosamine/UDP-N-acetylgalactosamine diphosphorylase
VVEIAGKTQIIEYSDLPDDVAGQRESSGRLRLWAGNLAVHMFELSFLERVSRESDRLPFHRARKQAAYLDPSGRRVEPQQPNALKFERFIFDLLPAADRALVVEVEKARAFAPVKNADGAADDTPQTARRAMVRGDVALLQAAGVEVVEGVDVEVNPLWALDAAEAASRLRPGMRIGQPTYFGPLGPRPSTPAGERSR